MKTKDIADFLSAELVGDPDVEIHGIAALDTACSGEISFAQNSSEFTTDAAAVIVQVGYDVTASNVLIKATDPKLAFTKIARMLHPAKSAQSWHGTAHIPTKSIVRASFIGAHVSIGEGTHIGESAQIHAGVRIGENVTIGAGTAIHPNCVIYDGAEIGSNCVIHAGTIIGSDGFGYVRDENGEQLQFPQIGSVTIEDRVEIGANCTVDRGSLGPTIIGKGTKIDNMVHIAHNVQIGQRVLIAAQTGIAGSCVIGNDVILGGQVGIGDHVTIMDGAIIGSKSGIFPHKIVRAGFWSGIPVQPNDHYLRDIAHVRSLEKLKEEVNELKKQSEK